MQKRNRVHIYAFEILKAITDEIKKGTYPNKAKLARIIGRHKRSIQRYIEAIRRLNAPLAYNPKRKGFYFTDPNWVLPPVTLTEGELISFFTAERFLRRLGLTEESIKLRTALTRMAELMPKEVTINLEALEKVLDFSPEPALEANPIILQTLTIAAQKQQTVEIDYYTQRTGKQSRRKVDVLCVHNHLGEWYAICFDHKSGEIRDFNIGRIKEINKTDKTFKPPANWNREQYLSSGFGMFHGGKPVEVIAVFDSDQARYIRERRYHPTQHLEELDNGRARVTIEVTENALPQVARWLLQYGEHVQVIAPPALRRMLIDTYRNALKAYGEL
ncbi:MAG: WYL domain-containing protein [Acidobacteriota bacterium]|nr:WYL domain-containing protein [Blastocatellia bacterium]MDW8412191.1 WYL domain-containing protein [Acidobacteriota bacterium]